MSEFDASMSNQFFNHSVEFRTIAETGRYINGLAFKPTDWGDEGMPIIRIQNLTNSAKPLNRTTRKVDPIYIVNPGDILVSWSATLDVFIWNREPGLLNQHIFKVVPDTSVVSKKFLFYTLKKAIAEMIKSEHLHGSTMKHINRGPFLAHKIEVPTLERQDEIVSELEKQFSRLDEAVANLQRVKANLKRYKASVLKAAVEGRLVETEASIAQREGRSYETGEQLLQRIFEERRAKWTLKKKYVEPESVECSLINSLPEGWVNATVEQISQLVEYGSSSKTSDDVTGIPVLRMGNIFEGELRFDDLKYLPKEHDEFPKLLLNDGDLLFNRTNSPELVGKVAVFHAKSISYSFASYLIRVRTLSGVLPDFLAAYINSSFGRQWVKSVVTQQVGQANVNGTKLQALAVPLPPLSEQTRIVAELDRHMTIIREIESEIDANLQRAQALRQATLSKAFGTSQ